LERPRRGEGGEKGRRRGLSVKDPLARLAGGEDLACSPRSGGNRVFSFSGVAEKGRAVAPGVCERERGAPKVSCQGRAEWNFPDSRYHDGRGKKKEAPVLLPPPKKEKGGEAATATVEQSGGTRRRILATALLHLRRTRKERPACLLSRRGGKKKKGKEEIREGSTPGGRRKGRRGAHDVTFPVGR